MIIYLKYELSQNYVEEIITGLGINYDDYEETVCGKRGNLEFNCDIYSAEDIIGEYISSYCEQGKSLEEAVKLIVSSDEDKDFILKKLSEVMSR